MGARDVRVLPLWLVSLALWQPAACRTPLWRGGEPRCTGLAFTLTPRVFLWRTVQNDTESSAKGLSVRSETLQHRGERQGLRTDGRGVAPEAWLTGCSVTPATRLYGRMQASALS